MAQRIENTVATHLVFYKVCLHLHRPHTWACYCGRSRYRGGIGWSGLLLDLFARIRGVLGHYAAELEGSPVIREVIELATVYRREFILDDLFIRQSIESYRRQTTILKVLPS